MSGITYWAKCLSYGHFYLPSPEMAGYVGLMMQAVVGVVNHRTLAEQSEIFVLGIPIEELLFGFTFGMSWSSVFEHLSWHAIKPKQLLAYVGLAEF